MSIFEYTDVDRDRVEVADSFIHDGHLVVTVYPEGAGPASAYLPPHEVTRLREVLAPYDPKAARKAEERPEAGTGLEDRRVGAVELATAQLASLAVLTGAKPQPGDVVALTALILGELTEVAQASAATQK